MKRWAIPLEDSPEDAVQKLLDAAEEHLKGEGTKSAGLVGAARQTKAKRNHKLARGLKTPQEAYRTPILQTIYELGGSAYVKDIIEILEGKMKPILVDVDYQKLSSSNSIRWQNTAQWERFVLKTEGLLKSDSPPGVWELSSKGVQELERARD